MATYTDELIRGATANFIENPIWKPPVVDDPPVIEPPVVDPPPVIEPPPDENEGGEIWNKPGDPPVGEPPIPFWHGALQRQRRANAYDNWDTWGEAPVARAELGRNQGFRQDWTGDYAELETLLNNYLIRNPDKSADINVQDFASLTPEQRTQMVVSLLYAGGETQRTGKGGDDPINVALAMEPGGPELFDQIGNLRNKSSLYGAGSESRYGDIFRRIMGG